MNKSPFKSATDLPARIIGLGRQMSWKQTFAALRYPNYRLWFWGQMISLFGSWMQFTSQSFLIYELTRSSAYLGLVGFAGGLPTWLFMLYAGVVADRIPRRKLLILTQTAMMILAFLLAGLTFFHLVRPWHILILAFGMGIANAFDAPARQAFVLEMVGPEAMTNAIALNSAMFNTATAAGPAVAGVVYALFGPVWCFTLNGVSFIAVIAALALMTLKKIESPLVSRSVAQDIREGLRFVAHHPMLRLLVITAGFFTVSLFATATLMPAWAVKILHGNSSTNGFLQSARGVGALLGALLLASLGGFKFRGKLLTLGTFAFPLSLLAFAFVRTTPLALLCLVSAGGALILIYNTLNALVQSFSPDSLRGRVMSIYSFVFFGFIPLGALWVGGTAEKIGEPAAVIIGAVLALLYATSIFVLVPKLRKLS